jgi:hypothetical protein
VPPVPPTRVKVKVNIIALIRQTKTILHGR